MYVVVVCMVGKDDVEFVVVVLEFGLVVVCVVG